MTISVFELFKVGIGPSSSHTVGPMRAAADFVADLDAMGVLVRVADVRVELYGSLAATGRGHGTLPAVLLGLEGYRPETIETEEMEAGQERLRNTGKIMLGGRVPIALSEDDIALYTRTVLDFHPNGMTLTAYGADDRTLHRQTYFSIGGGFVVTEGEAATEPAIADEDDTSFSSAAELLALASGTGRSISAVMLAHERRRRSPEEVRTKLLHLRDVMVECEQRGISRTGLLPGALHVRRRAGHWHQRLSQEDPHRDPHFAEDWVNLVALAVNEENASGGRIVTAPTNGAAGIIPAVLHYAVHYSEAGASDADDVAVRFLLTAGAIGSPSMGIKMTLNGTVRGYFANARSNNLSRASPSMVLRINGAPAPCIERNAISAGKAINAARMALRGDGVHRVSLDEVIATMRATGRDMSSKYKETSTGGLAVNVSVNYVGC